MINMHTLILGIPVCIAVLSGGCGIATTIETESSFTPLILPTPYSNCHSIAIFLTIHLT